MRDGQAVREAALQTLTRSDCKQRQRKAADETIASDINSVASLVRNVLQETTKRQNEANNFLISHPPF